MARDVLASTSPLDSGENMSQNEAFAAAAHLHVVLRRKTGRVTDTEWMVNNADYARAMVHFAREKARSEGLAELLPLADRLESLVASPIVVQPRSAIQTLASPSTGDAVSTRTTDISSRYIGRLR
jgi:hypothetical protein